MVFKPSEKGTSKRSALTKEQKVAIQTFINHGNQCGRRIAKIGEQLHKNVVKAFPLYRSAVIACQDSKSGNLTLYFYGDPHWMGGEVTKKDLPNYFFGSVIIKGNRDGPRLIVPTQDKTSELCFLPESAESIISLLGDEGRFLYVRGAKQTSQERILEIFKGNTKK